jgi:sorbitol-specific phosphotransferase system component IIBC
MNLPTAEELAALGEFDTPTICNALEVVMPQTRKGGHTVHALVCGFPDMAPVVGYACTATIRDLPQWAPGFQVLAGSVGPSHAFANLVAFDVPVTIAGMPVRTGDLVHADRDNPIGGISSRMRRLGDKNQIGSRPC